MAKNAAERPQDAPKPTEGPITPEAPEHPPQPGWECPQCGHVRAVGVPICPACGKFGLIANVVVV
jgi:rubrerythrin